MDEPIRDVALQLFLLMLKVAAPLATLRLAYSGLKLIAGQKDAVEQALREVILGLLIITTSQTIVWFIEKFSTAAAVFKQGW